MSDRRCPTSFCAPYLPGSSFSYFLTRPWRGVAQVEIDGPDVTNF
jgi:hypothetical protein